MILHALAFFTLYIYSVFAQIGYVYFPELSQSYWCLLRPSTLLSVLGFMFLSFLFYFFSIFKDEPVVLKNSLILLSLQVEIMANIFFSSFANFIIPSA